MKPLIPIVCAIGIFGRAWAADAVVAEKKEDGVVAPATKEIAGDELRLLAMSDGGGQFTLFVSLEGRAAQRVQALGTKVGKFELVRFDIAQEYADFKSPDGQLRRVRLPEGMTKAGTPPDDREILENISSKIMPIGTFSVNGKPRLLFGRNKQFEVGTKFTVTSSVNGQDYELELIAIKPPTFTLRYHSEEITRAIKPQ